MYPEWMSRRGYRYVVNPSASRITTDASISMQWRRAGSTEQYHGRALHKVLIVTLERHKFVRVQVDYETGIPVHSIRSEDLEADWMPGDRRLNNSRDWGVDLLGGGGWHRTVQREDYR